MAVVLSSFHWGSALSMFIGKSLANKMGPKYLFALSLFVSSLCQMVFPVFAKISPTMACLSRIVNGMVTAFPWNAVYLLANNWFAVNQQGVYLKCFLGKCM